VAVRQLPRPAQCTGALLSSLLVLMRRAEDGAVEAALRVELDALDVYELLRNLVDPEKPNCTLEQLNIVRPDLIEVAADARGHCSIITYVLRLAGGVRLCPLPSASCARTSRSIVALSCSELKPAPPWSLRAGCCSIQRCRTARWRGTSGCACGFG
jgi:hypothetical protein